MRIGIIALQHESNTFHSTTTTIDFFRQGALLTGNAILAKFADSHHEVGGFIHESRQGGAHIVPIFAAWAMPGGMITAPACDQLLSTMLNALRDVGSVDGLLVAPHGAAVSQHQRDLDGHWLSLVRKQIGPDVPMVCTLDPHANLSSRMVDACDATIAYRSNPHLDQRQRGSEAARLLIRTLQGEVKPTQAAAFPPVVINIERQETSKPPCRPLYDLADQMRERPGVLSNSILLGFPYADVEDMGSGFVVVTDNNDHLARQYANELASYLWEHRTDFVAQLTSVDDAVEQAATGTGPVCLLDMGDNIGGGSPGDGTMIAHALHRRGGPKSFIAVADPPSVEQAAAARIGETVVLQIGGKTDRLHGDPLMAEVAVRRLHDGHFHETQARHGGLVDYDMGKTAIVETADGLTVQLTSNRMTPFSLNQITCCDLDPSAFQILVAKGVVAPIAAYEQVCKRFIRVNTPGVTTADMESLDYRNRRRPLFPFEKNAVWA